MPAAVARRRSASCSSSPARRARLRTHRRAAGLLDRGALGAVARTSCAPPPSASARDARPLDLSRRARPSARALTAIPLRAAGRSASLTLKHRRSGSPKRAQLALAQRPRARAPAIACGQRVAARRAPRAGQARCPGMQRAEQRLGPAVDGDHRRALELGEPSEQRRCQKRHVAGQQQHRGRRRTRGGELQRRQHPAQRVAGAVRLEQHALGEAVAARVLRLATTTASRPAPRAAASG